MAEQSALPIPGITLRPVYVRWPVPCVLCGALCRGVRGRRRREPLCLACLAEARRPDRVRLALAVDVGRLLRGELSRRPAVLRWVRGDGGSEREAVRALRSAAARRLAPRGGCRWAWSAVTLDAARAEVGRLRVARSAAVTP